MSSPLTLVLLDSERCLVLLPVLVPMSWSLAELIAFTPGKIDLTFSGQVITTGKFVATALK